MPTQSPNFTISNVTNPIPHSTVAGTFPNPEAVIKAEVERLLAELRGAYQSDDQAIVAYVNAQFTQLNGIINGLAGGAQLQEALNTLQALKDIVDVNGDGILDALGPLNAQLSTISQRLTTTEGKITTLEGSVSTLTQGRQQDLQRIADLEDRSDGFEEEILELVGETNQNQSAIVGLANTVALNLQAIREGFKTVNVTYDPIALPDPVFATTNVAGDPPADPMDPADIP